MPYWLTKFTESLKLAPRHVGMAWIFCALIIFSPSDILSDLGITALQEEYRTWFGIGFILCMSVLAVHVGLFLRKQVYRFLNLRKLQHRLHRLTEEEKNILRIYISRQTRTQKVDFMSGVVRQLVIDHIIIPARPEIRLMDAIEGTAYLIQPWAWDYLNKHPDLVGLTNSKIDLETEEQPNKPA